MMGEPTAVDRLFQLIDQLVPKSIDEAGRAHVARALVALGGELRRLADDPPLRPVETAGADDNAPPLAQLLREVGAALGTPIDDEADTEALAARLESLLHGFTGDRARDDDEMQARIRASAERAIAESLRKRGITALGSSEP